MYSLVQLVYKSLGICCHILLAALNEDFSFFLSNFWLCYFIMGDTGYFPLEIDLLVCSHLGRVAMSMVPLCFLWALTWDHPLTQHEVWLFFILRTDSFLSSVRPLTMDSSRFINDFPLFIGIVWVFFPLYSVRAMKYVD